MKKLLVAFILVIFLFGSFLCIVNILGLNESIKDWLWWSGDPPLLYPFITAEAYYQEGLHSDGSKEWVCFAYAAQKGHRQGLRAYVEVKHNKLVEPYEDYFVIDLARSGFDEAQYILGLSLAKTEYDPFYIKKQEEKSPIFWLEKAANQGHAKAQLLLGKCYENGEGVEKNHEKAVFWLEKAAAHANDTKDDIKLSIE